jgi:hypothetical protein
MAQTGGVWKAHKKQTKRNKKTKRQKTKKGVGAFSSIGGISDPRFFFPSFFCLFPLM